MEITFKNMGNGYHALFIDNELTEYYIRLDNSLGCGKGNHYYSVLKRGSSNRVNPTILKLTLNKAKKYLLNHLKIN
jgi:hypothetical protein